MYAEGESRDSNPVIASLSNSLSRDSSLLTTPHSSFPPSPEKSVIAMTIKEEENVEDQTNYEIKQNSDKISTDNVVDDLVKENTLINEDTYSTHTISSSNSSSSENLNEPTSVAHELKNTFTIAKESNPEEQELNISANDDPHNIVLLENSHNTGTQGNPQNELKDATTTQGVDTTRENPPDVVSDNVSQPHSHCDSLESVHSTLTTTSSSDESPVATPTSSHSPKFQRPVDQRRSFFPPLMDFPEDKSTENPLQVENDETNSSKELATQLLSALEKELSNPLLKPTTCT